MALPEVSSSGASVLVRCLELLLSFGSRRLNMSRDIIVAETLARRQDGRKGRNKEHTYW